MHAAGRRDLLQTAAVRPDDVEGVDVGDVGVPGEHEPLPTRRPLRPKLVAAVGGEGLQAPAIGADRVEIDVPVRLARIRRPVAHKHDPPVAAGEGGICGRHRHGDDQCNRKAYDHEPSGDARTGRRHDSWHGRQRSPRLLAMGVRRVSVNRLLTLSSQIRRPAPRPAPGANPMSVRLRAGLENRSGRKSRGSSNLPLRLLRRKVSRLPGDWTLSESGREPRPSCRSRRRLNVIPAGLTWPLQVAGTTG